MCTLLNGFKYFYLTLIIQFNIDHLFAHKWFQILQFNICNSIYQVFLCNINNFNTDV